MSHPSPTTDPFETLPVLLGLKLQILRLKFTGLGRDLNVCCFPIAVGQYPQDPKIVGIHMVSYSILFHHVLIMVYHMLSVLSYVVLFYHTLSSSLIFPRFQVSPESQMDTHLERLASAPQRASFALGAGPVEVPELLRHGCGDLPIPTLPSLPLPVQSRIIMVGSTYLMELWLNL